MTYRSNKMHRNSLEAHADITKTGIRGNRTEAVLKIFRMFPGVALTDRQVLDSFKPGSDNINLVQPRITELRDAGYIREVGKTRDSLTRKTVRMSQLVEKECK